MVARLITPLMAAYLMRSGDGMDEHHDSDGPIMRGYTRLVSATTRRWYWRYTTLLGAIAFLIGSVMLLAQVPGSFLPPEDNSRVVLSVELPPNATLDETSASTNQIYDAVRNIPGVESVFILGGASPKGDLELRRATVRVILQHIDHSLLKTLVNKGLGNLPLVGHLIPKVEDNGRTRPQWDIEREIFQAVRAIPDVRISKVNDRAERDLTFNFLSTNEKDLADAVGLLESKLRASSVLANVSSEGALPRPELQIRPRTAEAARLGISPQQIAQTVRVATIGDVDANLAKISLDDRQIPIRVQMALDVRRDLQAIRNLKIKTAAGASVPLYTVADIDYAEGRAPSSATTATASSPSAPTCLSAPRSIRQRRSSRRSSPKPSCRPPCSWPKAATPRCRAR